MKNNEAPAIRELFIEELMRVRGGEDIPDDPLGEIRKRIRDLFLTTHACGEEGPDTC